MCLCNGVAMTLSSVVDMVATRNAAWSAIAMIALAIRTAVMAGDVCDVGNPNGSYISRIIMARRVRDPGEIPLMSAIPV